MSARTGRILALFRAEMKAVVRDRRAIVTSVILPLAIMPAFLFLTSWKARSTAKSLAEAHGGSLRFESVLGEGTRAILSFPQPPVTPEARF